jgi:hypothetical protein
VVPCLHSIKGYGQEGHVSLSLRMGGNATNQIRKNMS